MSEYLKKIIIPNLSGGEDEITILSPDDVYTKDQIDGFNLNSVVSVVKISQADYNRLDDYSAKTLYVIPGKRIYLGNSLIWKKPVYNDNDLAGTWNEDSPSYQWGFYSDNTFITLEDVTDVETKEFIKDISDYSGTNKKFWREGVKRLYHIPKNGGVEISESSNLVSADFSGVKFRENDRDSLNYCTSLKFLNLTDVDTSSITNMAHMIHGCSSLESLDLSSFNTSSVTDMSYMFYGCSSLKSLDLSSFDTSSVTNMCSMFFDCSSLESIDLSSFDTSSVTNVSGMDNMFYGCSSLKSLDLSSFDTSRVTADMRNMFNGCSSLKSLNLSSFYISSDTDVSYMFSGCNNLVDVVGPIRGIKAESFSRLDLGDCAMLSQDSAMVFIEGLETNTSFSTIIFSQNTYDSLTPEQISIATSKGWSVVRGN